MDGPQDEDQLQFLLQVVSEHRRVFPSTIQGCAYSHDATVIALVSDETRISEGMFDRGLNIVALGYIVLYTI